jgi:hypothetical protein
MKFRLGYALAVVAIMLSGCMTPPQKPVGLTATSLAPSNGRVGVAMTPLPKVDTHLDGAGCLLCYAAASAANSQLTAYTVTLPYEDLPQLKNELADLIKKKGVDVVVISDDLDISSLPDSTSSEPNAARKDFSAFQKKYGIEKLLVIDISALGMLRTYSSYFPTSDPKGLLRGTGYLVNLKTNTFEWYKPVNVVKSSDGKWDEPPKYPGLTNAYFQTIEVAKDEFRGPFSK